VSIEQIDAAKLHRWLTQQGFRKIHQVGSHVRMVNKDGLEIPMIDHRTGKASIVTTLLAKEIARRLGRDLQWLRKELGYGGKATGQTRKRTSDTIPPPSAGAAMQQIIAVTRSMLVEHRYGADDAAALHRVLGELKNISGRKRAA
jgi:predicted RNA binding protein YcfA (HicA-like mRNA interferase family)